MNAERKNFIVYTLYVAGLFGRNRKPKQGTFELHKGPAPISEEEVRRLMAETITREKIKPGARVQVGESEEWEEQRGDGILVRGFHIGKSRAVVPTHTL